MRGILPVRDDDGNGIDEDWDGTISGLKVVLSSASGDC